MRNPKIISVLQDLGLNQKEIEIYIGLFESGVSSIADICGYTKIARTTAIENIERLRSKGLVAQTFKGARKKYVAESPEKLRLLVERQKVEVEKTQKDLQRINLTLPGVIGDISQLAEKGANPGVSVRFYEDRDVIAGLYDEILKAKEVRAYFREADIYVHFPENFEKFHLAMKEKGVVVWDIFCSKTEEKSASKKKNAGLSNYHEKHLLIDSLHYMDYLIHDGKITIVQGEEKPFAIVLESDSLYENACLMHKAMWDLLP